MEYWELKADGVLILIFDAGHIRKNRFHSAKPSIPSFHYSNIPCYSITAKPAISDLN